MSKKFLIVFILILIAIAGITGWYVYDHRIPSNPEFTIGNTAGNINNNGIAFEMDGKVYFANASDNNCLYSMDPDETHVKQLTSMGVKYINGAGNYLYFYMDSTQSAVGSKGLGSVTNQYGIYRCRIDGSNQTCLVRDMVRQIQLCGNYLYFQVKKSDDGDLEKIKIDGTDRKLVYHEMISPSSVSISDGRIYFAGDLTDHKLHAIDPMNADQISTVIDGTFFFPIVQNGYVYYLDGLNNYCINRMNLANGEVEVLTTDRADSFTMNDEYIYYAYSSKDAPALKKMRIDGSDNEVVMNGICSSICMTSQYVYFKVYGVNNVMYHVPINGSAAPSTFIPKM